MSAIGRNAPCPCGSGRKYKHCCADADATRASTLRRLGGAPVAAVAAGPHRPLHIDRAALAAVPADAPWEIDVVPTPVALGDAPDARPAALLVAAAGLILALDLVTRPPSEPDEIAALLAATIREIATATRPDRWPPAVVLRHAAVARALEAALAADGDAPPVAVRVQTPLPELDQLVPALVHTLAAGPGGDAGDAGGIANAAVETGPLLLSAPESWLAWALPPEQLQALLAAAARFHAARPWTHLYNSELLDLQVPLEHAPGTVDRWTACVMGNAGEQFGLVLYADPVDFERMAGAVDLGGAFGGLRDAVLTLDFSPRHELPRPFQREFVRHGWPVAGPDAYPRLWAMNTPAGGVTRAQARALTLALDAVARFTAAHAELLATHPAPEPPLTWLDAPTGVLVAYVGDAFADEEALDAPWEEPILLLPGGAEGPRKDPLAGIALGPIPDAGRIDAFLDHERTALDRYGTWLASGGDGRRPLGAATVRKHVMNAEVFLDLLNGAHGAALVAVHEFDLRTFLYDWYPRKVRVSRLDATALPNSLRRFFQWLALDEELACPWATPILLDRESFEVRFDTFPGGHWWDADVQAWQAMLADDLDRRALLPPETLAEGVEWGATMAPDEARLHGELQRRWLAWRDDAIRAGALEIADVRAACVQRLQAWARAPHAGFGKRSPVAVIRAERQREGRRSR